MIGNYLTTKGRSLEQDRRMLEQGQWIWTLLAASAGERIYACSFTPDDICFHEHFFGQSRFCPDRWS